jgi:flagellar L-ring protein precursor FlgH
MNAKWKICCALAIVIAAPATAAAQDPAAPNAWANSLMLDHRARSAGDLVTIQIVENISAMGSADANLDKTSKTDGSLPWPIPTRFSGALKSENDSKFNGSGTTSRTAAFTATMSARVIDTKPNGDLMIVGVREIVINGDRQFVTLSGIVRPADIARGNIVASAVIADLRIQYSGQGFMKDNLSPGWLVRFLNKIF